MSTDDSERIHRLAKLIQNIIFNKPVDLPENFETGESALDELEETILYLAKCLSEANVFLAALCSGQLDASPPSRGNFLVGNLKEMQSRLNHVTWQAARVAEGDYSQHVSFFGAFSSAFNTMTHQLEEREKHLLASSAAIQRNLDLLIKVMDRHRDLILVLDNNTKELLYANQAAKAQFFRANGSFDSSGALARLYQEVTQRNVHQAEMTTLYYTVLNERYFKVSCAALQWKGTDAVAYFIEETTESVREKEVLENMAYKDPMTSAYNRRYGFELLERSLSEGKDFVLVMVDLDNLKYVNDTYGHRAGDEYIQHFVQTAREQLREQDLLCRTGGDEFLIFLPDCPLKTAQKRIADLHANFTSQSEKWPMSFSYGMDRAEGGKGLTLSELLHRIDKRMYEFKRRYKKTAARKRRSSPYL